MKSWKPFIIIRGGGDLATGTIARLHKSGYKVLVLETETPAAIRRQVAFSEAVYEKEYCVEDLTAVRINHLEDMSKVWREKKIPVYIDPEGEAIGICKPDIVVDAIIAKKNLGTHRGMAPLTIALGPGFVAGKDVDIVIETKRGHNLGRVIREGEAVKNTGIPGKIGGYAKERVIHAHADGIFRNCSKIGDVVERADIIAMVQMEDKELPLHATITGILRGLLRDGYPVTEGFKVADIDPRKEELANCFTISDKARCIAGSVLEVVCSWMAEREEEEKYI